MANVEVYAVVIVTMLLMVLGLRVLSDSGIASMTDGTSLNKRSALNDVANDINAVCEGSRSERGSVSIGNHEIYIENGGTELELRKDGDVQETTQVQCEASSEFTIADSGEYYIAQTDDGEFRIAT